MAKKKTAKKAPPQKVDYQPQSYSRGRAARKKGMDREYVAPDGDKSSWQEGWDYQDKIEGR